MTYAALPAASAAKKPDFVDKFNFFAAAKEGRADDVRTSLALFDKFILNANDENRYTATAHAAAHGRTDVLQLLIENKADLEIVNIDGYTPLMFAIINGHTECIKVLLQAGAKTETALEDGITALIFAAREGFDEAVDLLLLYKANVNNPSRSSSTPLMVAANSGHENCVKSLLKAGADITLKNFRNFTATDLARKKKHKSCLALLETHEKKLQRAEQRLMLQEQAKKDAEIAVYHQGTNKRIIIEHSGLKLQKPPRIG